MTWGIFEEVSSVWHACWKRLSCAPMVVESQVDAEQTVFREEMPYAPDVACLRGARHCAREVSAFSCR
jgi:hypothetical protein